MKVSWRLTALLLCGSTLIGCASDSDSAPDDTPAAPAADDAAGSGSSGSDSAGSGTDDSAAVTPAPAVVDVDPILVGLLDDFEDLPKDFAEIKSAYEQDTTSAEAIRDYVGTIEDLGMMQAQRGNADVANVAFARASTILTKALGAGVDLQAGQLPAVVYYNHACSLGKQSKGTEALAILNKAIDNGFGNMQQIKTDADLASVRELPEYAAELAKWEAHFAELQKKYEAELADKAREDLKKGEAFAFDFDLVDTEGNPLRKADLMGRVAIVDIWGTWCPPCRQEIPSFVKLQDAYGRYGFKMVGLNQERGPSDEANLKTVQEFKVNASINYPCGLVTEEVISQLPELKGYPTTLFIDHKGNVRMTSVGYHDYAYFKAAVEQLLTEQSAEKRANTN